MPAQCTARWLWLALCLCLAAAGCSRTGTGTGVERAAPRPNLAPTGPAEAVHDVPEYRPGLTGLVDTRAPEADVPDPILSSPVRDDEWLRERTAFWIDFWTTRGADQFGRYLERMARYGPVVDAELLERGLPLSLRYLPVVESGYHHGAVSRVGATGMWQFMSPTARERGLIVSALVDDRRDPFASTRAALDYLADLNESFDSWFLALAAYNGGPGRVARALPGASDADLGHRDALFLEVRGRLPAETRDFVPRFLAAAAIASDPERHGLAAPQLVNPLVFDEVEVPDATSLDVLAEAAGVDEAAIRELNPQFLRGFTPPGEARMVRVPSGAGETFEANFALIPPEERISFLEHAVESGETLTHISRRYSISTAELAAANGQLDPRRLQVGQRLIVPVAGARTASRSDLSAATAGADDRGGGSAATEPGSGPDDPSYRHVIRSGDSLWELARQYGVTVAELQRWNRLGEGAVLRPGTELVVGSGLSGSAPRLHLVRSGESWSTIARRWGVGTVELARANGRSVDDVIRVGEELRIP